MVWIFHSNDRFHYLLQKPLIETANTQQVVLYFPLFKIKLGLIIHCLYLAAAALPVILAQWLYTNGGWHQNFLQFPIRIMLFCLHYLTSYPIPNHRIFHKKGIAVYFTYTLSVIADIFNFYRKNIIFFTAEIISAVKNDTFVIIIPAGNAIQSIFHPYSILVALRLDSNRRLNPSQPVSFVLFSNSVNVCIFASVLSAKLSAIASIIAGFLGEPNSYSP